MNTRARLLTDDNAACVRLDACRREFPEVIPFKNASSGLVLAHHVANRFAYDARDFNSQGLMAEFMTKLAARLENSAESRP